VSLAVRSQASIIPRKLASRRLAAHSTPEPSPLSVAPCAAMYALQAIDTFSRRAFYPTDLVSPTGEAAERRQCLSAHAGEAMSSPVPVAYLPGPLFLRELRHARVAGAVSPEQRLLVTSVHSKQGFSATRISRRELAVDLDRT